MSEANEQIKADLASLVLELSNGRNNERKVIEADRKSEAEAERLRIMSWFQPVMDCAEALAANLDIGRKLYLFPNSYISEMGSTVRPKISIEISSRSSYAADVRKFTFTPAAAGSLLGLSGNGVRVKITKDDAHGQAKTYGQPEMLTVADACTLLMDRAADMIRHS